MSRRAVVKCDRCGVESEPKITVTIVCGPPQILHRDPRKVMLPAGWTILLRPTSANQEPDEFELCGACHAVFVELLRSPHKILTETVPVGP